MKNKELYANDPVRRREEQLKVIGWIVVAILVTVIISGLASLDMTSEQQAEVYLIEITIEHGIQIEQSE